MRGIADADFTIPVSSTVSSSPFYAEMVALLDENHLCAWHEDADVRQIFVADLGGHLASFDDTQVCLLDGANVVDLPAFCKALGVALGEMVAPSIDSPDGVVEALRRQPSIGEDGRALKRRYVFWSDAHVLLGQNPELFGRLVDAMMGVAAEGEFISEDLLFLQRMVFVGRAALDVYAENASGQFKQWFSEGTEEPLWRIITGLEKPAVKSVHIVEMSHAPVSMPKVIVP